LFCFFDSWLRCKPRLKYAAFLFHPWFNAYRFPCFSFIISMTIRPIAYLLSSLLGDLNIL
jgi:hypothetical protein